MPVFNDSLVELINVNYFVLHTANLNPEFPKQSKLNVIGIHATFQVVYRDNCFRDFGRLIAALFEFSDNNGVADVNAATYGSKL